jgi:hypothetical protein
MAPNNLKYGRKPLALIDLLGFTKYTLGARSINDIISTYTAFVYDAKTKRSSIINEILKKSPPPKFLVFSDSIIMYIDNDDINIIDTDVCESNKFSSYINYMIPFFISNMTNSCIGRCS